jgi:hypothetical protein
MKVYVLMINDSAAGVFSSEELADSASDAIEAEFRKLPNAYARYYSVQGFTVDEAAHL